MSAAYADLISYVQHLAPTWRKTQHEGFAQLLGDLLERPTLCLSDLVRAFPRPEQRCTGGSSASRGCSVTRGSMNWPSWCAG